MGNTLEQFLIQPFKNYFLFLFIRIYVRMCLGMHAHMHAYSGKGQRVSDPLEVVVNLL